MEQAPKVEGTSSGTSALSAGLGAITLGTVRFVEAKPHGNVAPNFACDGCAFIDSPRNCYHAIDSLAKIAFGGDCDERDVIYVEAPNVK